MSNKDSIEFYKNVASKIKDPKDVKLFPKNDNTKYDIELIKKYSAKSLIDFGSGTGLIINNLVDNFDLIVAVELFEKFSQYIIKHKKIKIINENVLNFQTDDKFALSTMFGTAHYFNEEESFKIYNKVFNLLEKEGIFILKNQFGVHKTKTITYSKELGSNYYAQYRELNFEIKRLKNIGFKIEQIVDIYPPEANRWKDTHFYAIVCKKKD